jgi:hypothetical protein
MASLLNKRDFAMQISDELLRGRTVIAADGQAIGEVAVLFFETTTWTIVSLQIKLSKLPPSNSVLRGVCSALQRSSYLCIWSSR